MKNKVMDVNWNEVKSIVSRYYGEWNDTSYSGAFVVSANYNAKTREAENIKITSDTGENMNLVLPWKEGAIVKDSNGNIIATQCSTVPNWENERMLIFKTTAGETYTVEKDYNI